MTELERVKTENAELKRQLEERRLLLKRKGCMDLLIAGLIEINLCVVMTQKWDTMLLYFFLTESVGLFALIAWISFCDSKKS